MKWATKDIDIYLREKEFIDTALIPLIPISLNQDMKMTVAQGEFISLLSSELERKFKGRIVHFPAYTYLTTEQDEKMARLEKWIESLLHDNFKYVIAVTSDIDWNNFEEKENCSIIWLPALPLEHMDDQQISLIIQGQINQIVPIFTQKWNV